jgi:hypothetical protein
MHLPFTESEFLFLFAQFNRMFWPVELLMWALTAAAAVWMARSARRGQFVLLLLAAHWLWNGLAFHAVMFTQINPRANVFAAMFVVQGLLFAWAGRRNLLTFEWEASLRQLAGLFFVAASLAYPALVLLTGHRLPAAPAFAVPCPTALFTVGALLCATSPVPRWLLIIPLAWSVIGGSAAFTLHVTPDLLLLAGAGALVPLLLPPRMRARVDHWLTCERDVVKPMLGDGLTADAAYDMTLTRVVDATPEDVWPWLMQLGNRRGGLYSYDWLDRLFGVLDAPSATSLIPAYQRLQPGDVIPVGHGDGFPVRMVRQNRSLVLAGQHDQTTWSWEIALDPIDERHTRITSRSRGAVPHTFASRVFVALLGPAAFLMTRRMLIGLAARAERLALAR